MSADQNWNRRSERLQRPQSARRGRCCTTPIHERERDGDRRATTTSSSMARIIFRHVICRTMFVFSRANRTSTARFFVSKARPPFSRRTSADRVIAACFRSRRHQERCPIARKQACSACLPGIIGLMQATGSDQADHRRGRTTRRPAAAFRRAEDEIPRIQTAPRSGVSGLRRESDDHRADRLRAILRNCSQRARGVPSITVQELKAKNGCARKASR